MSISLGFKTTRTMRSVAMTLTILINKVLSRSYFQL